MENSPIKKELILKLKQNFGGKTLEIETEKGSDSLELSITDDSYYIGSVAIKISDLPDLVLFFMKAKDEVRKLEEK